MTPQPDPASQGAPGEWLRHAESDVRLAALARQDPGVLCSHAAFHAQQAVEKAIKGVFVHRGLSFPRTHDLQDLIELLQTRGIGWPFGADEVEPLAAYAVHARYPGGFAEVRRQEVDQAIAIAEKVLDWARQQVHPSPGKR